MSLLEPRFNRRAGVGEHVLNDEPLAFDVVDTAPQHPLDQAEARNTLRKLLSWYYREREIQAENRLQMSIDADYYDGDQWDPADAATLEGRGQVPLVFNEVAVMCDWLIGTERRARVDWSVLPRTEEGVQMADIKTKVLKYVSDVNRTGFNRSRAFEDTIKVGVGWLDDGVRNDPTKDIIYSKYEDWRNVLWDSMAMENDLSDARYIFRTRWVDEDVAITMYPARRDVLQRAVEQGQEHSAQQWAEDAFHYQGHSSSQYSRGGLASGYGDADDEQRRRVRLIECQFRMPASVRVVTEGPFKGAFVEPWDQALMEAIGQAGGAIVDRVVMRMHVAVFTEGHLLALGPMPMRHNSFSLTPIWCYRRGRDRMPYGVVRRVRDLQMDLNKRASKALFLLSTNQIFAEKGAFDDINEAREEINQPDGVVIYRAGRKFEVHRDSEMASGQMQMMNLDTQAIQKSAGIGSENLGRQTNASSGIAIKARQMQGSVVTTQPFDNHRLAVQIQGEKQLSLIEQWYTEEKVIRLSGHKGRLDWVRINLPELQPDGSVRYLNDITASLADFIVSEQDYAGTLRQVMFESLSQMAGRMPPEAALRLLTIAMDYSDLPNREQIADEMRKLTGERDPAKPLTPEEQQQMQQQMQAQAEALQMQQEGARQALAEQVAKVREVNARAEKLEAEAEHMRASGGDQALALRMAGAAASVRRDADVELDNMRQQLAKANADLANKTLQIRADEDVRLQVACIEADSRERVAQIQALSRQHLDSMSGRLAQFEQQGVMDGQ
ncbi:hypothetical protein DelCs14_4066 [Delftia sp. Cs1-4]|uniref:portal protein n=1 Tax=unclassified Delftia TaxID=2613839 RepID=UPI00020E8669|nr:MULTISPECIES: hypothetical protein [unclassified Delftia]AEF91049.1 hypothetical protein DelCs14_4066 [Delftia sp. Cs1-4]KZK28460.1 hypothetical protein A4F85_11790 [Delftia sp. GW456-R20]